MKNSSTDWYDISTRFLFPFGLGVILMSAVNIFFLDVLVQQYPSTPRLYFRACVSPMIAAIQEPLTSKFLPAAIVVEWAVRERRVSFLQENRYQLAALGGLTVGVLEAGSKMLDAMAFSLTALPPVAMHTVTGLVVGGAVYQYAGKERGFHEGLVMLGAYAVAVGIHFIWNTKVAFWLAGVNPC